MFKLKNYIFILIAIFSISACDQEVEEPKDGSEAMNSGQWSLVWSDEFDSDVIDLQKWNKLLWRPGWVNNESQAYTARDTNLFVRNGKLVIRGLIEPGYAGTDYTGTDYNTDFTSGRVNTSGKANWIYGRFDIRAKLPKGNGSWPAIWMLGENISSVGWPHCGEIDIMEHVGFDDGNIHGSIHTTDYNHMLNTQKSGHISVPTATDSFHLYSLEWDSTYIRYLIDSEPFFFIYNDGGGDENKWPFNKSHYIILNLAIGGDWGGIQGIDPNAFPMEMEVDYVRVFKKSESLKNVNVTFQVDMKHQSTSGTGIWLSGGNISSGQPGGLQMESVEDTTIWEITLNLPPNSNYTYKYRNGYYPSSWSGGWESVPDNCGADQHNNRSMSVGEADKILPAICFSRCSVCE